MVRSCSRDNVPVVSYVFFFSSRRRHTRFDCDWSSDVCSSDLFAGIGWLEGVLQSAGFACVVVSHDRYFLENVTNEMRSEEHTSELQSQSNLVCRLLLEKKKIQANRGKSRRK